MSKQQTTLTPEEIFARHNTELQKKGNGLLHYDPHGYDAIIAAIKEYGQLMYDKGKEEKN